MSRHTSHDEQTLTLRISGMHCPSCELLLEREFKDIDGVLDAHFDYKTGKATIRTKKPFTNMHRVEEVLEKAGYSLSKGKELQQGSSSASSKWLEIGASLLIIFALWKLLQAFDLVSLAPSTSGALSLGGIFVIGLVAGTSSCLAVTGGLILALAAKVNQLRPHEAPWKRFTSLLHFNVGRLVSYFFFGGVIGFLGQSLTFSPHVMGALNVLVALVMLSIALSILEIIPRNFFSFRLPRTVTKSISSLAENPHPAAPFAMGALTFFLPCGFTQSLQLVALGSGSFQAGALTMFIFALGTLPALLGISALSSATKGNNLRLFLRFSGTLVLVLALFNLQSAFATLGVDAGTFIPLKPAAERSEVQVIDGAQEVSMRVTPSKFIPSELTIQAGVPVRWIVDGTQASGCTSGIMIPGLNISRTLERGKNVIEFTAPNPGRLVFSCTMGMVRGAFNVQ